MSTCVFFVIFLLLTNSAFEFGRAQQNAPPTHGTINLLIGSKFGLVAETDTMLSFSNGESAGFAQKLFQIDDHTICTIADFYKDPGPARLGKNRGRSSLAQSEPCTTRVR